jgi:hypothetical protein
MGEEGEATMGKSFTESFESRGGWTPRSPTTAVVQREREMKERGKKEEKEERDRLTVSLVPYSVTRAPASLPTWHVSRAS